ncbi:hypothetical protein GGF31_007550 [Allomyces arbusculus]|nr:hypothetical protein GGF31_007550 [Allomyces arbusculus]
MFFPTIATAFLTLTLLVDKVLPEFGVFRILPNSSLASSALSLLSITVGTIIQELHARNSLRILIRGAHEDALIMHAAFAAWADGVPAMVERLGNELTNKKRGGGIKRVGGYRLALMASAVFTWAVCFLWTTFSALMAWEGTREVRYTRHLNIPSVKSENPFAWNACTDALMAGNVSFMFDSGPQDAVATLLQEVYQAAILDTEKAIRNASFTYLDDFSELYLNGRRYMVMLPATRADYYTYNASVVAMNVTCAVKPDTTSGSLESGTFDYHQIQTKLGALPKGYELVYNDTEVFLRGYNLLGVPTPDTLATVRTRPSSLTRPGCYRGLCQAFRQDTLVGVACAAHAVLVDVTVTKGIPPDVLESIAYDPTKDWSNVERVSVAVRNPDLTPMPLVTKTMKSVLTGWTTASQWSWMSRALSVLFDANEYLLTATDAFVAHDFAVLLTYMGLGLMHHPFRYEIDLATTPGTNGCLLTNGTQANSVTVATPNVRYVMDKVVVKRYLQQTMYSHVVVAIAVVMGAMTLILWIPVMQRDVTGVRTLLKFFRDVRKRSVMPWDARKKRSDLHDEEKEAVLNDEGGHKAVRRAQTAWRNLPANEGDQMRVGVAAGMHSLEPTLKLMLHLTHDARVRHARRMRKAGNAPPVSPGHDGAAILAQVSRELHVQLQPLPPPPIPLSVMEEEPEERDAKIAAIRAAAMHRPMFVLAERDDEDESSDEDETRSARKVAAAKKPASASAGKKAESAEKTAQVQVKSPTAPAKAAVTKAQPALFQVADPDDMDEVDVDEDDENVPVRGRAGGRNRDK